MKLKLLLFIFLFWGGIINAQDYIYEDTIKSLVISEVRIHSPHQSYLELTNMGDEPVQLDQFELGNWGGSSTLDMTTGKTNTEGVPFPSGITLAAGETYVFAAISESGYAEYLKGNVTASEKQTQDNMWDLADYYVRMDEGNGDTLISAPFNDPFQEQWWGQNGFFIEQHFANGDSIVIDQVMGIFTDEDGSHPGRSTGGVDVAGFLKATNDAYLIRRFEVKEGNLDFDRARGVGLDDSEWIPIPTSGEAWRLAPWTVGNHGDYKLDENTLKSDAVDVDFANKTLTIPWGVWRGDDIMKYFEQKPGIGWKYVMAPDADSLSHAAQSGDQLEIYVGGNILNFATFNIVVQDPTADANTVIPVANDYVLGEENGEIESGSWNWPRVTKHESGNDTIWGNRGGIPYATPADTLMERLEKPTNASWEIVYASGVSSPYIENGDMLKVTAQNGSAKDYYIAVKDYEANDDASLSAIQWPDIPEFYYGLFGWIGDTIPGFAPGVYNYVVEVPAISDGIPALVAKSTDINATVEVKRAASLSGTVEGRTVDFTVTADDDESTQTYSVQLVKEKLPDNIQPYEADPFFSEYVFNYQWRGQAFLEVFNPGNQVLDLSNYMIISGSATNPADILTEIRDWDSRYKMYIPGYKWAATEGDWAVEPYIAQQDLAVNSIVYPHDLFVLATIHRMDDFNEQFNFPEVVDVQFWNGETNYGVTWTNQWGEELPRSNGDGTPMPGNAREQGTWLLKILNDSIHRGLKPATDPNDFEVIDVISSAGNGNLEVQSDDATHGNPSAYVRNSDIYKGNTDPGVSFGYGESGDVEWFEYSIAYFNKVLKYGWPARMYSVVKDVGVHYMVAPTHYMSTVSSIVYKVSGGYSGPQTIEGVKTGTMVSNLFDGIIKANEDQTLSVTSGGSELTMDALISNDDILTVLSADSTNTTIYVLSVSETGLSSNAVLTSNKYEIEISEQPALVAESKSAADGHMGAGTISGFDYGTSVQTVVNNVNVPAGATLSVISGAGSYVPLQIVNYDTAYVKTTVNDYTYFEVRAEDGTTVITYQLLPNSGPSDAFALSDLFLVAQKDLLIKYVPRGTNVQSFMSNVIPSLGATLKVVDKMGLERTFGPLGDDDKLIVTSEDGTFSKVYFISWLPTYLDQQSIYVAYILSDVYSIDQVSYTIYGASSIADISEFYSRIEPAAGATAVVIDENGAEKITGNINGSDMVKVTSADGKIVVMYEFGQVVSSGTLEISNIELYPNPTNGRLNVTGVKKGQRIQVFNAVGSVVMDVNVESSHEILNINENPAGLYLIVVSDQNKLLGRYKAVKY